MAERFEFATNTQDPPLMSFAAYFPSIIFVSLHTYGLENQGN